MPNFDIEIVQPNDGRKETRNYLITCFTVMAIALISLWMTIEPTSSARIALPNQYSNFALQLSNTIEELNMLEESELLTELYSVESLNLPQLHQKTFLKLDESCFVLEQDAYAFMVEKHDGNWSAAWAKHNSINDCHQPIEWNTLNHQESSS